MDSEKKTNSELAKVEESQLFIPAIVVDVNAHQEARNIVYLSLERIKPLLQKTIKLPETIGALTPDELFMKAAQLRTYLDSLSTVLSQILVFRLKIKNAKMLVDMQYKDELSKVYTQGRPEITKARGFEEKELLACNFMDRSYVVNKNFWEVMLSDIDDILELTKVKMRVFKGGLDTVLSQLALLKLTTQFRNFTTSMESIDVLGRLQNGGNSEKEEGETEI